ncbi:hypothetical protein BDZ94DRAFT_1237053 [Collybia nuda]|uniref:Uncharacterized protein n=1 Tax=Collybia nuda TaxID=64659 RepID=A0A9P6CIV7_9AGAR|nr:hypothetical protein BDZ94DRAFT_1237053 [Collybia nuda]
MTLSTLRADPAKAYVGGNLLEAGIILSLATNIITTAMFGYIYWTHRRDMMTGLGKHRPTQVAYFVVGSFPEPPKVDVITYARVVIESLFFGLSAIYATAVIALVNNHRTLNEMYPTDPSLKLPSNLNYSNSSNAIQFVVESPAATSTERISQRAEIHRTGNVREVGSMNA